MSRCRWGQRCLILEKKTAGKMPALPNTVYLRRSSAEGFLLKNAGFWAIYSDILILSGFSAVLVILSVAFFKRQI